jgi:hypothetical protein
VVNTPAKKYERSIDGKRDKKTLVKNAVDTSETVELIASVN